MSISPPQKSSKPSPVPGPSTVTPASGLAALNFSPTMIEIGSTVEEPDTITEPLAAPPPAPPAVVPGGLGAAGSRGGRRLRRLGCGLRRVRAVLVAAAGRQHQREGDGAAEEAAASRRSSSRTGLLRSWGTIADGRKTGCPTAPGSGGRQVNGRRSVGQLAGRRLRRVGPGGEEAVDDLGVGQVHQPGLGLLGRRATPLGRLRRWGRS